MKDISGIQIDNNEAISMGWLSLEDAIGFISNNMTRLPYDEELAQQYKEIFERLKKYISPELSYDDTKSIDQ